MEFFTIDKDKQYILYGAGGGAMRISDILSRNECNLTAYIDKRAENLVEIEGVPVWTLESLPDQNLNVDNVVTIITTKNVFEHQEIVSYLAGMGFLNTIYKPKKILQGGQDERFEKISKAHDVFLVDLDIPLSLDVPCTRGEDQYDFIDHFLIEEKDGEVLSWVPVELVFNYKQPSAYYDLNMTSFFPMVDLYEALLGSHEISVQEGIEAYVNYTSEWVKRNKLELTPDFKDSFVSSRVNIFSEMQKLSDLDGDFFIRNAPQVDAEDGIHFNLVSSGRNRVSFNIAKQKKYIPVKMKSEQYSRWINQEVLNRFMQYMHETNKVKVFSPIPHPKLVELPVVAVDYCRLFVTEVGKRVTKDLFHKSDYHENGLRLVDTDKQKREKENMHFLCAIEDEGTISQFLALTGYSAFRYSKDEYVDLLDELLYVDTKFIHYCNSEINPDQAYYCCILDNKRTEEELNGLLENARERAYLLVYNQERIEINDWKQYGFKEANYMFSTIWGNEPVSAIELIR